MENQSFSTFIKWHFNLINDKFYSKSSNATRFNISKNERLIAIVVAYIIFVASWSLLFVPIKGNYVFFIMANIIFVALLFMSRFSLLYYLFIFNKYSKINRSLNDRVIVDECILYKTSNRIRQAISVKYKIIEVKGNISCLKFILKNRSSHKHNDFIVLKITSNKIRLNGEVISKKRLSDVIELEDLLKNNKCD